MKKMAYLKTIGLLYLVIVLLASSVAILFCRIFRVNFLIALAIILVLAVPVSIIGFQILMTKQKKNPYGKLHAEFVEELYKNGYSEKFFEISEKAVSAHKNGEKVNSVYLKDFVLYTADYYNATEQYAKALSYIMLLNENDFTGKDTRFIDYGMSALMYYGCLMETYRGLNDKEKAIKMIERAKPILDRTFKSDVLSMGADTVYYNYYMLLENYERAEEFADKILSYKSPEAERYFTKYYIEAEFNMHLGKKQEAVDSIKKMEPFLEGETKILFSFYYSNFIKRLGLQEEIAQK